MGLRLSFTNFFEFFIFIISRRCCMLCVLDMKRATCLKFFFPSQTKFLAGDVEKRQLWKAAWAKTNNFFYQWLLMVFGKRRKGNMNFSVRRPKWKRFLDVKVIFVRAAINETWNLSRVFAVNYFVRFVLELKRMRSFDCDTAKKSPRRNLYLPFFERIFTFIYF